MPDYSLFAERVVLGFNDDMVPCECGWVRGVCHKGIRGILRADIITVHNIWTGSGYFTPMSSTGDEICSCVHRPVYGRASRYVYSADKHTGKWREEKCGGPIIPLMTYHAPDIKIDAKKK